ncbi:MAG: DUF1343 domain-containing protein [Phycisphaerales bacterium]|nr:DUF1343 domain-containing protein [Phycisphaerales bacterium]
MGDNSALPAPCESTRRESWATIPPGVLRRLRRAAPLRRPARRFRSADGPRSDPEARIVIRRSSAPRAALLLLLCAVICPAVAAAQPVLNGIDVLARDGFAPLVGRRVGLITNHTGVALDGRSTIELIRGAKDVTLVALFSPEHGITGQRDEKIGHSVDADTGLKVYSLYGETRRPTPEMLDGIDTLVYDIQDIGTRFYTYIATMGLAMEEAARAGIRVVVLDRPNPITGVRVFGPFNVRDGEFTAYHKTPLVHGMTAGELAQLFNAERRIGCDLHVIRMEGWRRDMWFDATGQHWINPSPNMRSLTQAALYPAVGMIEACKISVGRGTDTPFERFGAPWVRERELAERLNAAGLRGVRFVPFRFTPKESKFRGVECGGVQVLLTDRDAFDPAIAGLTIVHVLEVLHPQDFDHENVNRLLFNERAIATTATPSDPPPWKDELTAFESVRGRYLLYPSGGAGESGSGVSASANSGAAAAPSSASAPPAEKWESAIAAFEAQDRKTTPAMGGVVFVGSSSIVGWPTARSFPGVQVVNRGFGGSAIADSTRYAARIVSPYRPRVVVLYAGDNDVAAGATADQVRRDFESFVAAVRRDSPRAWIVFLSIKPSESRWDHWPEMQRANNAVRALCETGERLRFIDVAASLLNESGRPRTEMFRGDRLHLSEAGYAAWTTIVAPILHELVKAD